MQIEKVVVSPASTRWNATPPVSPNRDLLKGMEIVAKDVGVGGRWSRRSFLRREGAVGVAF